MVHNILINRENEIIFIHFIGYHMANRQNIIELVYQLQLFNKKIKSTSFKPRENAFTMRQKPTWHNVYFLELYKWLLSSLVPCIVSHQAQFVCFVTKSVEVMLVIPKGR